MSSKAIKMQSKRKAAKLISHIYGNLSESNSVEKKQKIEIMQPNCSNEIQFNNDERVNSCSEKGCDSQSDTLTLTLTEEIISLRTEVAQLKGRNSNQVETSLLPTFPFSEMRDLKEFDEQLLINDQMRAQLKRVIERVGGHDIPTFIRAATKQIISDKFAINLTWRGTPEKPSIQQFTTFSLIKDVCHSMFANATDLIINKIAQQHFLHARDRVLKRKANS